MLRRCSGKYGSVHEYSYKLEVDMFVQMKTFAHVVSVCSMVRLLAVLAGL